MAWFTRGYISSLVLSVAVLYLVLAAGAVDGYNETTEQEAEDLVPSEQDYTWIDIYLHNLQVTFWLTAPIVGLIPFLLVWWNTGHFLGAAARYYGVDPRYMVFTATQVNFLELLAYAVLVAESIYILFKLVFDMDAKTRVREDYYKTLALYAVLLLAAAVVEVQYL